jgi:hypothetical protein
MSGNARKQLELPLRVAPADCVAAIRARSFYCEHYRCTLTREACIERQQAAPVRHGKQAPRDEWCAGGRCLQGLGVLIDAGLIEHRRCPLCHGKGKVPRE